MRLTSRLVAVTAVTLTVLLAGCTAPMEARPSASPSPAGPADADPPVLTQPTDVPTAVPNDAALRGDVVLDACESAASGWRASGTVGNPYEEDKTFTLTVFFTTETATVLATGEDRLLVPAGETVDWAVDAEFDASRETRCVLTGVAAE